MFILFNLSVETTLPKFLFGLSWPLRRPAAMLNLEPIRLGFSKQFCFVSLGLCGNFFSASGGSGLGFAASNRAGYPGCNF
jgi:hypothetical protein